MKSPTNIIISGLSYSKPSNNSFKHFYVPTLSNSTLDKTTIQLSFSILASYLTLDPANDYTPVVSVRPDIVVPDRLSTPIANINFFLEYAPK